MRHISECFTMLEYALEGSICLLQTSFLNNKWCSARLQFLFLMGMMLKCLDMQYLKYFVSAEASSRTKRL